MMEPMPTADVVDPVIGTVAAWRDSLMNLTGRNRLLNFKPSKLGSIEIASPNAEVVVGALRSRHQLRFRSLRPRDEAAGPPDLQTIPVDVGAERRGDRREEFLDVDKEQADLAAALRSLMRRSAADYLDRGVWVLYLAVGFLNWSDVDESRYRSPLLLVPVRLVSPGPKQSPYLEFTEDDPQTNPALAMKLQQFETSLPTIDDVDELSPTDFFAVVRESMGQQQGWEVDESLTLSYFSFAKEAMYRDLLENEERIANHPLVAALALGAGEDRDFTFDELPVERIDVAAAPESTPLVLDADSSQRSAIAAALQGRSFVLDGPPGTGKSQTIANMIGALLHAGKRILFVSEKAAALDVVKKRLTAVGLDSYLLELHSHQATRREVAAALGTALNSRPIPPNGISSMEVAQARRRREELNGYAQAMNVIREPLGLNLHRVLGMLSALQAVPAAPPSGISASELTIERLAEVREHAAVLQRAWRPASRGRQFLWRGVVARRRLDAELYEARSALVALQRAVEPLRPLMRSFGLRRPSDAVVAGELAMLFSAGRGGPHPWLIASEIDGIDQARGQLAGQLERVREAEQRLSRTAGGRWTEIPRLPPIDLTVPSAVLPPLAVGDYTAAEARRVAATFDRISADLRRDVLALQRLASTLGLRVAETPREVDALLKLGDLARVADRADRRWLTDHGLEEAQAARPVLLDAAITLRRAEEAGRARLADEAAAADLEGLVLRFETVHRGLGKLKSSYREDRRRSRALLRDPADSDLVGALRAGIAWQEATSGWAAASARYGGALGSYFQGRDTDFAMVERALEHAVAAQRFGTGQDLAAVAALVSADSTPDAAVLALLSACKSGVEAWHAFLSEEQAVGPVPELGLVRFEDAIAWLDEHRNVLEAAAEGAAEYGVLLDADSTLTRVRDTAIARAALEDRRQEVLRQSDENRRVFGSLYRGLETDVTAIDQALAWARSIRQHSALSNRPLTPEQLAALVEAAGAASVADVAGRWRTAVTAVVGAFDIDRGVELRADLDDWSGAAELLDDFQHDSDGQDEWLTYTDVRRALVTDGLDRAVDFCIRESVDPQVVPAVLERALLQEWAEEQLRSDPALAVSRAQDRDAIVAEYRDLDRALIGAATHTILEACNARRPRATVGESAIIQTEAGKKRKHMPVRTLISRTRTVTQAIKPCFMMSPLAVSQFLDPDITFDVVIFDEASQVTPADAINCIYRGAALITAGDRQQLPPTNFFGSTDAAADDDWSEDETVGTGNDFESVLDLARGSGALNALTLRWHYRSRHESLIAFSNTSFYEGRLITFPSSTERSADSGVELFKVAGVYRRGSSRDNPVEAAAVAARVMHHFDTRPGLTLGVVAFSEAQAAAIEVAVDDARVQRPDLAHFFTADRLDGFFVKNLESVQGDERDVMIFSIGYGPDELGRVTMNFGPMNREGGYRRLNVAVTRARYRNEVVTSIEAADITAGSRAEGIRHLKRYLDYAARGPQALALEPGSYGDAESPFEESVIAVIRSWGYEVTPQVGTAGYRIDMGVRHPDRPEVFVLGVECDGFQYHSSKVARDRDRLREDVLNGLGWTLHRIWGTAWYRNRSSEEQRLRAAIEHAVLMPITGLLTAQQRREGPRPDAGVRIEAVDLLPTPEWLVEYRPARVAMLPGWVDLGETSNRGLLIEPLDRLVAMESPVHLSVVHQRLRDAWGIGRIGSRIRATIDGAIDLSTQIVRDGEFLLDGSSSAIVVREPAVGVTRTIEQVHTSELAAAMVHLVVDAGGIGREELMVSVARMFGWARRGVDITDRLGQALRVLLDGEILVLADQSIRLGPRWSDVVSNQEVP